MAGRQFHAREEDAKNKVIDPYLMERSRGLLLNGVDCFSNNGRHNPNQME